MKPADFPAAQVETALREGLAALELDIAEDAISQLLAYLALLHKWNSAYNLTAVRDPVEMVPRHIIDSLAVLPHVKGPRILDVGTGAGLPGLVLAMVRPDWQFTLLDSNQKKTRFLQQVVLECGLPNVTIAAQRIESHRPESPYDTIVSRAFTELAAFVDVAAPHCRGQVLAMKGPAVADELAAMTGQTRLECMTLDVPGLDGKRYLVRWTPA